ncbi:MAG: hydroxysqualene dehydroxylase HpnE [Planctomycetota bacterium]
MAGRVTVVGGGIAGIAASLRLAEAGIRVTLVERSNRLGGRAGSFRDGSLEESIDNCQHVALGCCSEYLGLLATLGVADRLAWTSSFHYVEEDGRTSTLPIPAWPSPLHGLPLLARAGFLTIGERFGIARALLSARIKRGGRWSGASFRDWLAANGQSQRSVERFWAPIIVSACNARPEDCDATSALKVFQDGFLRSHRDAKMAVPTVPLSDLYQATDALLARVGGEVRLGTAAREISRDSVTLRTGETIDADAVVLATPLSVTADLLDSSPIAASDVVRDLRSIRFSPIVAVHAEYESSVSDLPHVVLLGAPFDWLFFKDGGRRVHAVASAADGLAGRSGDDLIAEFSSHIRDRFGVTAEPVWARVVKERRATFLVEPGVDALRPSEDALAPDVWIAGDFTATGWPATMEGATRSGRSAAEGVVRYLERARHSATVLPRSARATEQSPFTVSSIDDS